MPVNYEPSRYSPFHLNMLSFLEKEKNSQASSPFIILKISRPPKYDTYICLLPCRYSCDR
jgi:hypothetical protein